MRKYKNSTGSNFSGSSHFEYFLKTNFLKTIFFLSRSAISAKINSLKVYRVFSLSINLMTLIVPIFLSFSRYYLKDTTFWESNFLLTLFSQYYSKTGNQIPQKFVIMKISAQKPMFDMKI